MKTNSQEQTTDNIEADLSALAAQADAEGVIDDVDSSAEQEAERAASDPDNSEQADADKAKDKPENGTSKKSDGTEPEKKGEPKPEPSKYEKERQRLDKTWKGIEERKTELDRREQELAEREKQVSERAKDVEKPIESKDDKGFTASDYDAAAKTFRDRGDDNLADAAEKQAKNLRTADQQAQGEGQQKKFLETWHKAVDAEIKARPELADESHELSVAVQKLLKDDIVFSHLPDGFTRAVEIADLRIKAGSVPSLTEKVAELQKEIDRLNGERQPGGSGPTSKPKAKSFDQLSSAEQERELLRMAEEADAEGVGVVSTTT